MEYSFYKTSVSFLTSAEKKLNYHQKPSHKMDFHILYSNLMQDFLTIKYSSSEPWGVYMQIMADRWPESERENCCQKSNFFEWYLDVGDTAFPFASVPEETKK